MGFLLCDAVIDIIAWDETDQFCLKVKGERFIMELARQFDAWQDSRVDRHLNRINCRKKPKQGKYLSFQNWHINLGLIINTSNRKKEGFVPGEGVDLNLSHVGLCGGKGYSFRAVFVFK